MSNRIAWGRALTGMIGAALFTLSPATTSAKDSVALSPSCDITKDGRPDLFVWKPARLAANRERVRASDPTVLAAYTDLISDADSALTRTLYTVTSKTKVPPSGDRQDYFSIGPYWWPNPGTDDGLPYVRRDGETNPERKTDAYDNSTLSGFARSVEDLTLAGYFSGKARYMRRAAELVDTFLLDPETRMNPNMNYAQAIPGRVDGRGIGIIDSYNLVAVVDSIGLLAASGALDEERMTGLRSWFSDYSRWLVTSKNGREERAASNNHGTYYDAQLAVFAAFAGDYRAVPKIMDGVRTARLATQIGRDGAMTLELKRTRPFHYTSYNINAFADLADTAQCFGDTLWTDEVRGGRSIIKALSYQMPYADPAKAWPYDELREIDREPLLDNMLRALPYHPDAIDIPSLARLAGRYPEARAHLLY